MTTAARAENALQDILGSAPMAPLCLDEGGLLAPDEVLRILAQLRTAMRHAGFSLRHGWQLVVQFDAAGGNLSVGAIDEHARVRECKDAWHRF